MKYRKKIYPNSMDSQELLRLFFELRDTKKTTFRFERVCIFDTYFYRVVSFLTGGKPDIYVIGYTTSEEYAGYQKAITYIGGLLYGIPLTSLRSVIYSTPRNSPHRKIIDLLKIFNQSMREIDDYVTCRDLLTLGSYDETKANLSYWLGSDHSQEWLKKLYALHQISHDHRPSSIV